MNNNYENLPAVLNANQLAAALGISRAGAYQLLNTGSVSHAADRQAAPGAERQAHRLDRADHGGGHVRLIKKRLPRFHLLHQMGSIRSRLHAQTV